MRQSFSVQRFDEFRRNGRTTVETSIVGFRCHRLFPIYPSYKEYIAFKERHRNKLLIFVSHADGKRPDGRAAIKVMYDASLKIWVEGYKAFSKGRFIGPTGECTIYEEGARKYWG